VYRWAVGLVAIEPKSTTSSWSRGLRPDQTPGMTLMDFRVGTSRSGCIPIASELAGPAGVCCPSPWGSSLAGRLPHGHHTLVTRSPGPHGHQVLGRRQQAATRGSRATSAMTMAPVRAARRPPRPQRLCESGCRCPPQCPASLEQLAQEAQSARLEPQRLSAQR